MDFLSGKKTYIIVGAALLVAGAEYVGVLPPGTMDKVDGLLAVLGLGTLRDAIKKK